jgi:ParB family chromosome partitioning protein
MENIQEIPLTHIEVKDSNVRTDLNSPNSQDNLKELAENIRLNGLLQPIVLRGTYGKPPYEVIVGQRRFLAHQLLGEKNINAVFSAVKDDIGALLLSLSENMCRQEMNFEDTSNAITKLYTYYKKDERQVQAHTGFSIQKIRSYIKIEEQATPKIKQLLIDRKVSLQDAKRAIDASQGDPDKADALVDELAKLTTYEKKRLLDASGKNPKASVNDLIQDAKKPRWEETVILNLTPEVSAALRLATEKLSMDAERLAMDALINWLTVNDFLIEQKA